MTLNSRMWQSQIILKITKFIRQDGENNFQDESGCINRSLSITLLFLKKKSPLY